MKANYDFTNALKNPYAKKLREEGYTVVVNYPPSKDGRDAVGRTEPARIRQDDAALPVRDVEAI